MTLVICFAVMALGAISDFLFGRHLDTHPALAWPFYAAAPNMQFFLTADALTQRHDISFGYLALTSLYAGAYVCAVLCLATALFQTRETG